VELKNLSAGEQTYLFSHLNLEQTATYFLTIETAFETATQKIVLAR
jgi:hypothetical protein